MNLDDFKIKINQKLEDNPSFEMSLSGITNLHQIATTSILEKIKKSLAFEIIFGCICVVAFVFIALFSKYKSLNIYFGFFSILIALITLILYLLFNKTKKVNSSNLPIKQNLISLHSILAEFVKRYLQFTMLLIPICFISAVYLGYNDMQYHEINSTQYFDIPFPKRIIVTLTIVIVVFCVLMYFFTKWYLKKLYGNHLAQLKEMINQIDL